MFLKQKSTHHTVEILSLTDLFDPFNGKIIGRYHYGEEVQDPEQFSKVDLMFLSGEELPRCWTTSHYRDAELLRSA